MSGELRRTAMIADKHIRDSARAVVEADIEHIRADFARRSLAGRAVDRVVEGATDVYEEAIDVAEDHKGALAAIIAALFMWFARNPILDALLGDDGEEDDDAEHCDG